MVIFFKWTKARENFWGHFKQNMNYLSPHSFQKHKSHSRTFEMRASFPQILWFRQLRPKLITKRIPRTNFKHKVAFLTIHQLQLTYLSRAMFQMPGCYRDLSTLLYKKTDAGLRELTLAITNRLIQPWI